MKKIIAFVMAMTMVFSMAVVASAESTTTLTTTVPSATYTLNIPADAVVPFGQQYTTLGNITVTDGSGFASGKNVEVTVTYDAFKADSADISTTIPFTFVITRGSQDQADAEVGSGSGHKVSGSTFTFAGKVDGSIAEKELITSYTGSSMKYEYLNAVGIYVSSENWGKALAGNYTASITFTAKVVAEQ